MKREKNELTRPLIKSISGLSKNDYKIIEFINKYEFLTFEYKIEEFAEKLGISTSSISRFTKKYGFKSYSDFKVNLNLVIQKFNNNYEINNDESFSSIIASHRYVIDNLYNKALIDKVSEAANIINKCKKVLIQGSGSSKRISENLYANMIKIGKTPVSHPDFHVFFPSLANAGAGDVLILFSDNLNTPEQLFSIKKAYENKLKIIVITSNDGRYISEKFDVVIQYNKINPSYIDVPLSSKLSQLLITDLLFEAILLNNENLRLNLKNSKKIIKEWVNKKK
ncbi:MurR/RpiR family transcriptional regulator [Mycoplasmopsis glycophila]|uniref:Als operon repressor n=1 Tax=Mycoplasmopsis glycophila TaxID=171285 RepID=A0A449AVD0_9BACT|nr:MurR/RpiR family transcriptional regulator [Mycoplasmopsis glycophila]VEU70480.1 Als operon repressor [Mycoplasmopsis glycophila]